MTARLLVRLLRDPASAAALDASTWNAVISAGRAERLLGTLAVRLVEVALPDAVRTILAEAQAEAKREQRLALWEANRAALALNAVGVPMVLLKGAAYVAADLSAAKGRQVGDLDILVPRDQLDVAEAALLAAGWEYVKPDPYDDAYYRRWMHELPPMIHRERDRMIDVHHTILPLTARPMPDADALLAGAERCASGYLILSVEDRVCHAVAHLIADGDLSGGLRNLWDIHCLCAEIADHAALMQRAHLHGLAPQLARAIRLADALYGAGEASLTLTDRLFLRRLLSSDSWGRDARRWTGRAFYIRSHLLRMPPLLLARHLSTKWRKGHRPA